MNPETKIILNEMKRSFIDHDLKWDLRFLDQEDRITCQILELERAQEKGVSALEEVTHSMDEWRAGIDGTVDDMRLQVKKLSIGWERASIEQPGDKSGVFAPAPSAVPRPSVDLTATPPVVVNGSRTSSRRVDLGMSQPSSIPRSRLNALEEVLPLFSIEEPDDAMDIDLPVANAEVNMILSAAALTVAAHLPSVQQLCSPVHVKVASGQLLVCSQYIPSAVSSIQGPYESSLGPSVPTDTLQWLHSSVARNSVHGARRISLTTMFC